jgi:thiamine-phosphate pyrophosphorylase
MRIDPLYPLLPDANWVARLVPLGLHVVQLRVKDQSDEQARAQIIASQAICDAHGARLIVNDFWRLAIECGAAGVHLGQEDLDGADLHAIRAGGLILGLSTHDDTELARALACEPDYIALGPVFGTTSKDIDWGPQGTRRITQWRERVPDHVPLVAIGGITLESATEVLNAGADSVAVIGDILNATDPDAHVRHWLKATSAWRA